MDGALLPRVEQLDTREDRPEITAETQYQLAAPNTKED